MQNELPLSVVITTHNRPKNLQALLGRLLPFAGHFELFVVSDGAIVAAELLAPFQPCLTYIQIPATGGPATGRNLGLSSCRGRYVIFCDDDDLLEPEWVSFFLQQCPAEGHLFYANYRVIRGESFDLSTAHLVKTIDLSGYTVRHLNVSNNLPVGAFAVSRKQTGDIQFLSRLQTHEDWDYLLQVSTVLSMKHVPSIGVSIFLKPQATESTESRNYKNVQMHPFDYLALYRLNRSLDAEIAQARASVLRKFGLVVPVEAL